ncbi:hypothetical protein [Thermosulfuriphilus sp.]
MSDVVQRSLAFILISLLILSGCSGYGKRVAPVTLPQAQAGHVEIAGAYISARVYLDPRAAKEALGFDARGAGLLPVQVVIDNQGQEEMWIDPTQTFLIDQNGQAWPLLTSEEAYNRIKGKVDVAETAKGSLKPAALLGAAGALVGFAVGVVTGEDVGESTGKGAVIGATAGALAGGAQAYATVGEKIKNDLAERQLHNQTIEPGLLAHGFLFFPGKAEEVSSVASLRLALRIGGELQVVNVPLTMAP